MMGFRIFMMCMGTYGLLAIGGVSYADEVSLNTICDAFQPDDGVASADYVAGVDAKGNAVASADLNAVKTPIAWPMKLPVELDVLEYMDVDLPAAARDALRMNKAILVDLELHENGRVVYNGQDLSDRFSPLCTGDKQNNVDDSAKAQSAGILGAPDVVQNDGGAFQRIEDVGEALEGQYP